MATTAPRVARGFMEGLAVVFFPRPGAGGATNHTTDLIRYQPLVALLRRNDKLRRIAALAGRFKRMAATKRRQRVRHGADEITDVEQGADLGRIL